jgi:protein associated with RNAse G/E
MTKIKRLLGDVKKTNDMALEIKVYYEENIICLEQKEWDGYKQFISIYPKDIPDILKLLLKEYEKWEQNDQKSKNRV